MEFKKIIIGYFHITKLSGCKYEHNEEIECDNWCDISNIISDIINCGYNVQIIQNRESKIIYIWIDNKNFKQR